MFSAQDPDEVPSAKRRTSQDSCGQSDKTKRKIELKSVLSDRKNDGKDSVVRSEGTEKVQGKKQQQPEAPPKPPALAKEDSIEKTLLCQICQVRQAALVAGLVLWVSGSVGMFFLCL